MFDTESALSRCASLCLIVAAQEGQEGQEGQLEENSEIEPNIQQ